MVKNMDNKATNKAINKAINAMIRYNGTGYHRHLLRDIQPDGAFVEMGNVRVLRKDSQVDVVFVHHQGGSSNTHRVDAKVARVERGGALLKFLNLDEQALQALSSFRSSYQGA